MPSTSSSPSARRGARERRRRGRRPRRSAWRRASRTWAAPCSPRSACVSTRTPRPERRAEARAAGPGDGMKPRAGSSALMRNSIACPRVGRDALRAAAARRRRCAAAARTRSTPRDLLGDRVLDLQARVHLHEVEALGRRRAGTRSCRRCGSACARTRAQRARRACARARLVAEERRRRLLEQLLVAALHRALALAEHERAAVRRRRAPAPRRGGRRRRPSRGTGRRRRRPPRPRAAASRRRSSSSRGLVDEPHAAPAAARGRLEQHRVADLARPRAAPRPRSASRPVRARARAACPARASRPSRATCRPGPPSTPARRPDERSGRCSAHARTNVGLSREEAVARVHASQPVVSAAAITLVDRDSSRSAAAARCRPRDRPGATQAPSRSAVE